MRECYKCGKPYEAAKYAKRCDSCRAEYAIAKRKRDIEAHTEKFRTDLEFREKLAEYNFVRRYGISRATRDQMVEDQGGVCPICETSNPVGKGWVVDHDHSCCPGVFTCGNCIRGVVCALCNSMLGFAKDDLKIIEAAASYLRLRKLPAG